MMSWMGKVLPISSTYVCQICLEFRKEGIIERYIALLDLLPCTALGSCDGVVHPPWRDAARLLVVEDGLERRDNLELVSGMLLRGE